MKDSLKLYNTTLKYRAKIFLRQLAGRFLPKKSPLSLDSLPQVTLFISSLNTRYPLELTIKSLLKNTSYPNFQLLIADNASVDGSLEYLESLQIANIPIKLIKSNKARLHSDWLDEVYKTVDTPYWIAVDSDLLFFCQDWIVDMVNVMQNNPNLYLLNAEKSAAEWVGAEPVSGEIIEMGEHPSTWLFCVKTDLRDHVDSSFKFANLGKNPETGRAKTYDTGGVLLNTMREKGLRYDYMPSWFFYKYYHFGSMSWGMKSPTANKHYLKFKQHQINHIKEMVNQLNSGAA